MPNWGIELTSNDPALLSFLVKYREELLWYVREVEGKYYLISSYFQDATNPEGVRQAADDLLFLLNGILKLKFKYANLARGNTVGSFDDHGQIIGTTVTSAIGMRLHLSVGEQFFQTADVHMPSMIDIWLTVRNYPKVEEAIHHYANQTNWFNLFKVYEVIAHDIGKDTLNKWTQGKGEDFTYSANNARVSGYDARHFSEKFSTNSPRLTPMSLSDAQHFIDNLLTEWLKTKQ